MKQKLLIFLFFILPLFSIGQSKVFDWVTIEQKPEFPGGEGELMKFIAHNVIYPKQAKDNGISGTVYISFIINKKGKVVDVIVARGVAGGSDLDAEAVRVIKLMPKWKPGKQKRKKVSVKYSIPIKFVLK